MSTFRISIICIIMGACGLGASAKAWQLIAPTPRTQSSPPAAPVRLSPPRLDTPTILSPASGTTFRMFPRTVRVRLSPDGWAGHRIELSCDFCTSHRAWEGVMARVSTTELEYTFTVPGDNMYRIRVQGFDGERESAWTTYRYFYFKT